MDLSTRIISTGGPDVAAREFRNIIREANFEVLRVWHRLFVPEHFQTSASSRYAYQARKRGYMAAKANAMHHQRPLVWSGRSEQMICSKIMISGNHSTARGRLFPPDYFYKYRKDLSQPDKVAELTRTIPAEDAVLAHVHREFTTAALNALNQKIETAA